MLVRGGRRSWLGECGGGEENIPRIQSRDVEGIQRRRIGVGLRRVGVELDGLKVWLEALLEFDARLLRALSAAAITNHVSHGIRTRILSQLWQCGSLLPVLEHGCRTLTMQRREVLKGLGRRVCEREVRKVLMWKIEDNSCGRARR